MQHPTVKIAVLVSSLSRNAGGLLGAVSELSKSVYNSVYDITVLSAIDQYTYEDLNNWPNIPVYLSRTIGPISFGYQPELLNNLKKVRPNIIHTHGIWMYPSLATSLYSSKRIHTVISPHGMLDPWAVKNSLFKKKVAGFLFEYKNLRNASCIHALNYSEYKSIRRFGLKNPVAIIPNGVNIPDDYDDDSNQRITDNSKKTLLFLGRIHPKKGLESLIQAWSTTLKVSDDKFDQWRLMIVGWDQGDYLHDMQELVLKLNLQDHISFVGPKYGKEKLECLSNADAFILPSHSEGLPMSILEAWAAKLPVIMTAECNIPQGFESNAAIKVQPNSTSISEALIKLANMSQTELDSIGQAGFELIKEEFDWEVVGKKMQDVYAWLLTKSNKPDFIMLD